MIPAIFGLSGPELTPEERAFFKDADPAGYILFARNCIDRDQMRALTDSLRGLHGREHTFICIDQEGGRVARMKPPVWQAFPAGDAFARLYDVAPASAIMAMRMNAHALGLDLAEVGVSVDCLPLLDVRQNGAHDVIGDRALGEEPMRVAALGRATLDGLAAAGVAGIVKHIPGHGRARADSHKELPTVRASDVELEVDIAPFCDLASHARIAMTAHIVYAAWDAEKPATQSPTVVQDIIRSRIGFDGLLLSDDLDMEALEGTIPERAVRAIAAGCDVALNCWAMMDDMVGIANALPQITARGSERLAKALEGTNRASRAIGEQSELLAIRDSLLEIVR